MKIKLAKNQYEYIKDSLLEEKKSLVDVFQRGYDEISGSLQIPQDIADDIRDWAIERQQREGFDLNFSLTSKGKILQELIDLFYT